MMRGLFINFEGIDGSGKTGQIERLHERMLSEGMSVIVTREPGGPPLAEEIRTVALRKRPEKVLPITELLLFYAARNENYHTLILPAINQQINVISDRFSPSSVAYQVAGRGMNPEIVRAVDDIVLDGATPDITIVLDIDMMTSNARISNRGEGDRLDEAGPEFRDRVRGSYLEQAANDPEHFFVVNAMGSPDDVHEIIYNKVSSMLRENH
ncbi:dTMP kinase [Pseudomonas syringae pv. actinidiae]|nr:dTMP kinase [Pseudomonas syringae pv. actinidiae]